MNDDLLDWIYSLHEASKAGDKAEVARALAKIQELNKAANAQDQAEIPSDDMGGINAGRIGLSEGLAGTAGAIAAPAIAGAVLGPPGMLGGAALGLGGMLIGSRLPKALSRAGAIVKGGVEPEDVEAQYNATTQNHPTERMTGDIIGGLFGAGVAGKVAKAGMGYRTARAAERGAQLDNALKEARLSAMRPEAPEAAIKPPQGSFPPIEGSGGGRTTQGLSVGEARALNAPRARAVEAPKNAPNLSAHPDTPRAVEGSQAMRKTLDAIKGQQPEMRGYSRTGSTTPSRPQAHRVGVSKGVPQNPPHVASPPSGLDGPMAQALARKLLELTGGNP